MVKTMEHSFENERLEPQDILFVNLPTVSPGISESGDAMAATESLSPPLGILYLANSVKDKEFVRSYKCVDYAICDYNFSKTEEIEGFVSESLKQGGIEKPSIVAVSLLFSAAYEFFTIITSKIKKCWPDTVVIVGGIHASNTVEYLLKNNTGIDYVACGEGEDLFVEFVEMVAAGEQRNIFGLHSLNNIKRTETNAFEQAKYVSDLNIDFTKYSDLIDMEVYTARTSSFSLSKTALSIRSFSIMASRGCPFHCTFCASWTVHGYSPRWRDIQNVVDEIYWLHKTYGVTKFYLIDDNFVPKSKTIEFFNTLSEIDIPDFEIVIQNMSVNATNFEIIDAIVAAGITNIAFAVESGSKKIQKKIKKNVRLDKAAELVAYSKSKGLNIRCFFIVGFPGETVEDMEETFECAKELRANWSTFSVASPIPGTEMYDEFVKLGYIENGPSSWTATTLRDRVFDTREISREDIKKLAYRANLYVNFINNINIDDSDYENAETIFLNFVKTFNFHIFAYDCLRRIYKQTGKKQKEDEIIGRMRHLMATNKKSQSFVEYFDLLDDECRALLSNI